MAPPFPIRDRLQELEAELGTALAVEKYWKNEFFAGYYCRFSGTLHSAPVLEVQVAGSLAVDLRDGGKDEVDLFVFVNGIRVSPDDRLQLYLHRTGAGEFIWTADDPGFERCKTIDSILMGGT